MTKHLSKKSKKTLSNRIVIVIYSLVLVAIILFPFLYHVPYITTIEVIVATIAVGAMSGLILNGLLQVIFGFSVTLLGVGSIVYDSPKYLIVLYPLMFVTLVVSNTVAKRIARKILPYNSSRFQAIVSAAAILVMFILSIAVALGLNTPTPLAPLAVAIILTLAAGYVTVTVANNRKVKFRKAIVGAVLAVTALVIGVLIVSWPVLLMVAMLNFLNGIFISSLFQQSNAVRRNKKFNT